MKQNILETYIWKDAKLTRNSAEKSVEYRLIDMEETQLNFAYNHCKHMLYNTDVKNPGRMIVLNTISEQLDNCLAELAHRWFLSLKDNQGNSLYSDVSLISDLKTWANMTPKPMDTTLVLSDFVQVPPDYKGVSIQKLKEACQDALGLFNHSKITLTFLYRLGVYFTSQELVDIQNYTEGNTLEEKFDVLKAQLNLNPEITITANPKGLSEQEFRDMIHMKHRRGFQKCKYSDLTTSQLETLTHKVLYALENQVVRQVHLWTTLMKQIEEIAEFKHFKLD